MPKIPSLFVPRKCSRCGVTRPASEFLSQSQYATVKYTKHCQKCLKRQSRVNKRHKTKNPKSRLWESSRHNARCKGLEHTITLADIPLPETCKYLGVLIDYRCAVERGSLRSWNAPSIDRIDSTKGYVPGNIQIISDLANRMKQNATIEQLLAFAQGVIKVHG